MEETHAVGERVSGLWHVSIQRHYKQASGGKNYPAEGEVIEKHGVCGLKTPLDHAVDTAQ